MHLGIELKKKESFPIYSVLDNKQNKPKVEPMQEFTHA